MTVTQIRTRIHCKSKLSDPGSISLFVVSWTSPSFSSRQTVRHAMGLFHDGTPISYTQALEPRRPQTCLPRWLKPGYVEALVRGDIRQNRTRLRQLPERA